MKKLLLYSILAIFLTPFFVNAQVGLTCENPIIITSLPYQTVDNTANYGNAVTGPQLLTCIAGSVNYQSGNDVFYSYTAVEDAVVSFTVNPTETRSSIFIYPSCAGTTGSCLAAVGNTTNSPRIINYNVVAGATYVIVISSNSTTPTVHYNLLIQKENCVKPTNLAVANATLTAATFSWDTTQENALSHQVALQPQGSSVPTGVGQYTGITTSNFTPTDLTAGTLYQYWVRSECSPGVFSAWAGPVAFNTVICDAANQCAYTFRMTDTSNNGWNGAIMQIRQNGIVLQTIGATYTSGAGPVDITVPLCKDIPFDVFWDISGSQPQQCVLSILNSFGQTEATVNGINATVGTSIFAGSSNCDAPLCNLAPTNITFSPTTTGGTVNWQAPGTENVGFDVYIVPTGGLPPSFSTLPSYSAVNGPAAPFSYTITGVLIPDTSYDVYVRVQCDSPSNSPWSGITTFTTLPTCPKPINQTVTGITTNSAVLGWTENGTATQWEVLLLNAPNAIAPAAPGITPIVGIGDIYMQNLTTTTATPTLENATIYYYYVRAVCQPEDASKWTGPFIFNTITCESTDKCSYRFLLTNTTNNIWNGGRMQVRQNGIVVATLGTGLINNPNGVSVSLCNNVPFDLYWSVAGTFPDGIGLTIINPFNDVIFNKLPGQLAPLTVLFADATLGNCTPPTCPKPSELIAYTVSQNSAQLSWTEIGSATQWEVYLTVDEGVLPVNGTPLNTDVPGYYLVNGNTNFIISELIPSTKYTYYVRAICSANDISNWTILNPKTFNTKPLNDECSTSITIPVNPTPEMVQTVSGSTLGATASVEISNCPGNENDDVWYSFVATNTTHIIKINSIMGTGIQFAIYSGTDCSAMTQLYCSSIGEMSKIVANLIPGQTYKIRVYTNGGNPSQFVTFNFGIITPLPITNDECATAIPLTVNEGLECLQFTTASITGATASVEPNTCVGLSDDDVWFSFVATQTSHIVKMQFLAGTATYLNSSIYQGDDCGNLTFITCINSVQSITNLIVGTTYKIRVWSNSSQLEDIQFSICIQTATQPIVANTTQYTVPQLVNDILINSLCSTVANVTWSTGTTDTTNGIGYFNKSNSDFPFEQGIILSTGNAAAAAGPNSSNLSDGGAGGDADLSAILAAQVPPVTGTLYNATKLEFDFVAVTDQINFNFLFASEEYGVFQCAYADAFAFILTNLTAATPPVNLAVLPGTTIPVSVVNIRDIQYNASCASQNVPYFGNYYNNLAGQLGAPINFNGITVPMTAGATVIPGNSYHIKMVIADYNDMAYDSAVFLQGGSFNPGDNGCTDKIKLIAFNDTNNNGIKEETETSFTYGAFEYLLNDTGEIHNLSSPIGAYTIFDPNSVNSYDFTFSVHPEYATYFSAGTTSYNNISIAAGSGTQILYFPIAQIQGYNDVNVSVSPIGQPRPGFTNKNKVVYTNLGTAATSGTISYTKDPAVSIVNNVESGLVLTPTGFTYDFSNLASFETRNFTISLSVPPIPIVNLDDILTSSVQITAPANDINVNNNSFNMIQTVVASYDPNDKMEAHGTTLDIDTFNQEDYLYYTIRFQNTGTTNAIDIRIEDLLDAQLDEASMRMVSSSHTYLLERVGSKLVWKFPGINLPSMIQNEVLSQGYITFRIKVKPGFEAGDVIPNFAEIYFDTNPAIITNTFQSTFGSNLSTPTFDGSNLVVYPNPAKEIVQIMMQNSAETMSNIIIYDMIGKTIKTISGNNAQQISIPIHDLSTGVYLIEITTGTNLKQVRKLMVN